MEEEVKVSYSQLTRELRTAKANFADLDESASYDESARDNFKNADL